MGFRRLAAKRAAKKSNPGGPSANLLRRVRAEVKGGRIACASAFVLAEKLKIPRAEMGRALDELEIRITRCQLGCF
jgi:LAO/AO transport system kinase